MCCKNILKYVNQVPGYIPDSQTEFIPSSLPNHLTLCLIDSESVLNILDLPLWAESS